METRTIQVLLIEDDEEDFVITRKFLSASTQNRFVLTWAGSLAAGLELLQRHPDIVLLDLSLPDSTGWETFHRVRERSATVPIILLTGLEDESLGVRAVHEGAQDYLVKSRLDSPLLCRSILHAIERKLIKDRLEQVVNELQERNEQMAADLRLAREVQQALLPQCIPAFPPVSADGQLRLEFASLYRPCQTVGGDFFSILPLSGTTVGLFACDVMGHGMRSALVTAILRGLLEELRPRAHDPGTLLTKLNRALSSVLRQPQQLIFASAVYLTIDTSNGAMTGANAGHPPPLHYRAHAEEVTPLRFTRMSFGPALGITGNQHYETCEWNVRPLDRILLYTDGLADLKDPSGLNFGIEHVSRTFRSTTGQPPGVSLKRILSDAEAFAEHAEFEDDICLVMAALTQPDINR